MPLSAVACTNAKAGSKPLKMADAGGLYLLVNQAGKYWRYDYRFAGKRKTMALGVFPAVSLADARKKLTAAKEDLSAGVDPMGKRHAQKRQALQDAENSFERLARDWLAMKARKWSADTLRRTTKQFEDHLFPALGHRPATSITPPELLMELRKVSGKVAYTATRLRECCGGVFRFGIATGRANDDPAADLRGALEQPATTHRPALTAPREFGQFLRDLKAFKTADVLTLLATRLALLTFVRSQELRFARWEEIDTEARVWRIPAARMKMAKGSNQAHIVPLSQQAVETLAEIRELSGFTPVLFPNNHGADGFMSENTIGRMLWRMGYKDRQTLHGFRASARSLLSERGWSVAALERQLDHAERSKVVAAYARSEHLDERRRIMEDWGRLVQVLECGGVPATYETSPRTRREVTSMPLP
jgi:integrase